MTTQALITLSETHWSGWDGGSYSTTTKQVWTQEKTVLSPVTMGHSKDNYRDDASSFYEIEIDRIVQDVVVFGHRRVVIKNADGTINLGGETTGKFILRWGESKELATPTMDSGTVINVKVAEIR